MLKLTDLDEARRQRTTDIIARQAEHMTELIDDLLDVSRVTRGLVTLNLATLDLAEVLNLGEALAAGTAELAPQQ